MDVPPAVRALAEDPFAHCPDPPAELGFARLLDDRFVVHSTPAPSLQLVEQLRLRPEEVGDAVAEARAFLRSRGMNRAFWMISDSTTPDDLESRLGRGMTTNDQPPLEEEQVAMALVRPPAAERRNDVEAEPVRTVEDALAAVDVMSDVFSMPTEQRTAMCDLARRSSEFAQSTAAEPFVRTYVARLEGEIVGTARCLRTPASTSSAAQFSSMRVAGTSIEHSSERGGIPPARGARCTDRPGGEDVAADPRATWVRSRR